MTDNVTYIIKSQPVINVVRSQEIRNVLKSEQVQGHVSTIGIQGPQGEPGIGQTADGICGAAISKFMLLVLLGGELFPAEPLNLSHAGYVVGVAAEDGIIGEEIQYVTGGELQGGTWITGQRYFAGSAGLLSTAPLVPLAKWRCYVGISESAISVIVILDRVVLTA